LSRKFGVGKVQINGPINGEYAYDFIWLLIPNLL
jgi:hypothetical protein